VPFVHKPANPDPDLIEKLKTEWPGILRWMINGCVAWQKSGLVRPKVVLDATAEYFAEQDIFAQWLEECCELDSRHGDNNTNLFASWRAYASGRSEDPHTSKWLATMLERHGFQRGKDCTQFRGRGFLGLRVTPEAAHPHWQDQRDQD
jgi:putative DNA primase/helicase